MGLFGQVVSVRLVAPSACGGLLPQKSPSTNTQAPRAQADAAGGGWPAHFRAWFWAAEKSCGAVLRLSLVVRGCVGWLVTLKVLCFLRERPWGDWGRVWVLRLGFEGAVRARMKMWWLCLCMVGLGQGCGSVVKVSCPEGEREVAGQGCVALVVERPSKEPAKAPPSDGDVKGMVEVPAGQFLRGTRGGGDDDERPQREIHLDGFWIDKYEVTVDDYARCVSAGACSEPSSSAKNCSGDFAKYNNWGKPGRGKHPVNCVDWDQAVAYCKWAGKRLPTEAQWEKAARGTDGRTYPWGEAEPSCEYAVMGRGGDGCGRESTWEVGSKAKGVSPYGAYDMAGNVFEWTADWYGEDYYEQSPARNPMGPESGSSRVTRGASWGVNFDAHLRAADRSRSTPSGTSYNLGLRCARSLN